MWPDIYFVATFWTNKFYSPNTPGGGGGPTSSEQIAANLLLLGA